MSDAAHDLANHLAHQALADGRETAWFDQLYETANGDPALVPWAHLEPNPLLVEWLDRRALDHPQRAVQVGCGLGDDGQALARSGYATTAFDISPAAVDWCRRRFPDSDVDYVVADLLAPPDVWGQHFDLVFECHTIQALPIAMRTRAIAAVCDLVAPGGTLLVVTRLRETRQSLDGPPWPLTREEMEDFVSCGLVCVAMDVLQGADAGAPTRCVAEYQRPA